MHQATLGLYQKEQPPRPREQAILQPRQEDGQGLRKRSYPCFWYGQIPLRSLVLNSNKIFGNDRVLHKVGSWALAQRQRVKVEVAGAAVRLVFDRLPVIIGLTALFVIFSQGLNPQPGQEHWSLHFVKAKGTIQAVLCTHDTKLIEHGTPVGSLAKDGQEPYHCKAA